MGGSQCVMVHRTFLPQVQDFALPFVEPYEVFVKVPLDGSTTLWHIDHSSHFVLSGNLLS